jgi:hypothetical protein
MIDAVLPDIKSAWMHAYMSMLDDEPGAIDYYQRNIIHSFSNKLIAEQGFFDYDLGDLGLTITKWTKFTGMYVDVDLLHAWINNAMNVRTYEALYPFKSVPPQFGGRKAVHQWGPCLLGFSFRRQPKPPTLTLFTRTQSLGFSGVADYALCHFVAKKLAERIGIDQREIRIVIQCGSFVIKMVETLHFLEGLGKLDEYAEKDNRIGESIRYYQVYLAQVGDDGLPLPELKWRAANRMRTKLERVREGTTKSLPVDGLTLKGWDANQRQNSTRRRSNRQVQEAVLRGSRKHLGEDTITVR